MNHAESARLFSAAKRLIPGGVNSPVRACRAVGCDPIFIVSAEGATICDADGNRYVDFVSSWGPMILGHAAPPVVEAICQAAGRGASFGASTPGEVELAALVCDAFVSIDKVRFVNSGTEATMSAIRLARGFTGKDVVVKFDGCYHGHADSFLVKAGSGVITLGIAGSPGVPTDIVKNTISIPYNDNEALEATLRARAAEIACVIVEPVAGNMGCVPPQPGFLEKMRALTRELGIILIFDEVITGFRLAYGGAQELYGIEADLTCLGKIIGGGLPVGAYGGRAEIMNHIAPDGPVYQAGTLSGNPLAMAAGAATLRLLRQKDFYPRLNAKAADFAAALGEAGRKAGLPMVLNRVGSLMTGFFTEWPVMDYLSAMRADTGRYARHYQNMLASGFALAPSQFEALFVSAAHEPAQLEAALAACAASFARIARRE
ncbi:MAG: glutamate-1-semialdehyde 2,1-aminomutase [Desulfobulbaceae bacterium]|nr:glutamate-1-semialdehyde 2,1-aminomutase [Desulfobulbaceae bacterium]